MDLWRSAKLLANLWRQIELSIRSLTLLAWDHLFHYIITPYCSFCLLACYILFCIFCFLFYLTPFVLIFWTFVLILLPWIICVCLFVRLDIIDSTLRSDLSLMRYIFWFHWLHPLQINTNVHFCYTREWPRGWVNENCQIITVMPVRINTIQFAERPYSIVSWRFLLPSVFVNVVRTTDFTMYFTIGLQGHAVLCGLFGIVYWYAHVWQMGRPFFNILKTKVTVLYGCMKIQFFFFFNFIFYFRCQTAG